MMKIIIIIIINGDALKLRGRLVSFVFEHQVLSHDINVLYSLMDSINSDMCFHVALVIYTHTHTHIWLTATQFHFNYPSSSCVCVCVFVDVRRTLSISLVALLYHATYELDYRFCWQFVAITRIDGDLIAPGLCVSVRFHLWPITILLIAPFLSFWYNIQSIYLFIESNILYSVFFSSIGLLLLDFSLSSICSLIFHRLLLLLNLYVQNMWPHVCLD